MSDAGIRRIRLWMGNYCCELNVFRFQNKHFPIHDGVFRRNREHHSYVYIDTTKLFHFLLP